MSNMLVFSKEAPLLMHIKGTSAFKDGKNSVSFTLASTIDIDGDEEPFLVSNGMVWLTDSSGKSRKLLIRDSLKKQLDDEKKSFSTKDEEEKKEESQLISEEETLKMEIDPRQVTSADIDKYENLMQGSIADGVSNANFQTGEVDRQTKGLKSNHTWRNVWPTARTGDLAAAVLLCITGVPHARRKLRHATT